MHIGKPLPSDYFAAYERAEDLNGMLDCLVMKSKLANWSGDETSASQCDKKYLQLLADQ